MVALGVGYGVLLSIQKQQFKKSSLLSSTDSERFFQSVTVATVRIVSFFLSCTNGYLYLVLNQALTAMYVSSSIVVVGEEFSCAHMSCLTDPTLATTTSYATWISKRRWIRTTAPHDGQGYGMRSRAATARRLSLLCGIAPLLPVAGPPACAHLSRSSRVCRHSTTHTIQSRDFGSQTLHPTKKKKETEEGETKGKKAGQLFGSFKCIPVQKSTRLAQDSIPSSVLGTILAGCHAVLNLCKQNDSHTALYMIFIVFYLL